LLICKYRRLEIGRQAGMKASSPAKLAYSITLVDLRE
jgi:hypothetical protein